MCRFLAKLYSERRGSFTQIHRGILTNHSCFSNITILYIPGSPGCSPDCTFGLLKIVFLGVKVCRAPLSVISSGKTPFSGNVYLFMAKLEMVYLYRSMCR